MQSATKQKMVAGVLVAAIVAVSVCLIVWRPASNANNPGSQPDRRVLDVGFDGNAAYRYLKEICELGPRPSGSPAMEAQQQLLAERFREMGGKVSLQPFDVRHPEDGSRVTMRNLIVQWHPDRKERVLLCCHYDTRPYPDQDPRRPKGRFIGANDGASGAALLLEMGRHMSTLRGEVGVDFVLFDGEEFLFDARRDADRYFMGSTYFSKMYVSDPPPYRYRYGVLLDMVGDAELQLFQEKNSLKFARSLVHDIWNAARSIGVREFIHRPRTEVRDDHLPLNNIAKIPSIDIIDFDYPRPGSRTNYWHTESDIPANCSADSLLKVGAVVLTWLRSLE